MEQDQQRVLAKYRQSRADEQAARRERAAERAEAAARDVAVKAAAQEEHQHRVRARREAAARAGGAGLTHAALQELASAFRQDQRTLGDLGTPWAVAAWAPDLPPAGSAAPASVRSPWEADGVVVPWRAEVHPPGPTQDAAPIADDEIASYQSDTATREDGAVSGSGALAFPSQDGPGQVVMLERPKSPDAFCSSCIDRDEVQLTAVRRATLLRARPYAFQPLLARKGAEEAARERLRASGFLTALSGAIRGTKRRRDVM